MKKLNNKHFIVLVILSIIGIALVYQSSYAKYVKSISGRSELSLAKWNIKLNNETIIGKSSLNNTLTAYFPETDYVNDGFIAPTVEGYFDIEIDSRLVDVTYTYEIKINREDIPVDDIEISKYEILESAAGVQNYNSSTGIVGTVQHNSDPFTIRVYVKWIDGTGETFDNTMDTYVATHYTNIPVGVVARFVQVAS